MASPSLRAFNGVVGLFPSAFLARLSVSLSPVESAFGRACNGSITPLALNLHNYRNPAIAPTGCFNLTGQCNSRAVGGIYTPAPTASPTFYELNKSNSAADPQAAVQRSDCGGPCFTPGQYVALT